MSLLKYRGCEYGGLGEEENLCSMLFCCNGKPECNDITRQQRYHNYPIHIFPRHSCTAGRESASNYTEGSFGRYDTCSALYVVEVIVIFVTTSTFGKTCLCEIGYILVRSINSPSRSQHEERGIFTLVCEQSNLN